MKRINAYKKLFNVEKDTDLKQLKKTYRGLVKQWHPDKFQEGDPLKEEAEQKSTEIIDAYHFLVSMNAETKAAGLEAYKETLATCGITDYHHKGLVLEIIFSNGTTYEYFGMTKPNFQKMINSGKPLRYAKRNVFGKLTYRKSKRDEDKVTA